MPVFFLPYYTECNVELRRSRHRKQPLFPILKGSLLLFHHSVWCLLLLLLTAKLSLGAYICLSFSSFYFSILTCVRSGPLINSILFFFMEFDILGFNSGFIMITNIVRGLLTIFHIFYSSYFWGFSFLFLGGVDFSFVLHYRFRSFIFQLYWFFYCYYIFLVILNFLIYTL